MNLEENLIQSLSNNLLHFSARKNAYRFHCPYCQVNQKNSKGKPFSPSDGKGFLYKGTDGWNFKCHREKNCGRGTSFAVFLEENFPSEFMKYVCLRELHGTTGKHTNCPKLSTVLDRREILPNHPPKFHDPTRVQESPEPPPEAPPMPLNELVQLTSPKITKLPPMRSPAQQSGHQAKINKEMKLRKKCRIEKSGELW